MLWDDDNLVVGGRFYHSFPNDCSLLTASIGINAQIYAPKDNCTWKLFNVTTVENTERPGYLGHPSAMPETEFYSDDSVKEMENKRNSQYVSEFNAKYGDFAWPSLVETFISNPFDRE